MHDITNGGKHPDSEREGMTEDQKILYWRPMLCEFWRRCCARLLNSTDESHGRPRLPAIPFMRNADASPRRKKGIPIKGAKIVDRLTLRGPKPHRGLAAIMGVFARVAPRAYSGVARLNSIATSSACNTHNSRYRCRQSAIWYNSQRTVPRNTDS